MAQQSTNKKAFMNYMKAFGIFYLLIWHAGCPHLNVFVILFFLQMFFFISGYFYKDEYTSHPMKFISKRIKTLYIPFVFYCTLLLLLNNLFVHVHIYENSMIMSSAKLFSHFLQILSLKPKPQLAGAMWFVSALIITCVIFCVLSYLIKFAPKKNHESIRMLCVVILLITANYLSLEKIRLPVYTDIAFMAIFFYYTGYLYQKYETIIPNSFVLALSSVLILALCTKYGHIQIAQRKYIDLPFLLVCGLTGIYFNLYISKLLAAKKTVRVINYIGENTLIILALHFLAFKAASLFLIHFQHLPIDAMVSFPTIKGTSKHWWWLYALSGLLFPLIIRYNYEIIRSRITLYLKTHRQ